MTVPAKVHIYDEEATRIARFVLQYPIAETGGDLFGYWTHSGSAVVSYIIGPGIGSRHAITSFYQDESYLYDVGTQLYREHGLQHVGEWHSHHRLGLNEPSAGDRSTVQLGMRQKSWSRFLLLIATIHQVRTTTVHTNFFLFTPGEKFPEPIRIVRLPGASPFRLLDEADPREEPSTITAGTWVPGPLTPAPERQPVEDVFAGAWFATASGKALLRRAAEAFSSAGIAYRMIPIDEGKALKVVLPGATLILGERFPDEPPRWEETELPVEPPAWSATTELAEWYREAQKGHAHGQEDKA